MKSFQYPRLQDTPMGQINARALEEHLRVGPWIDMDLQNGWVNYTVGEANAQYRREPFGIVRVRGVVKSGTTTVGTQLAVLKEGYAPPANFHIPIISNNQWAQMKVQSDGQLIVRANWSAVFASFNFTYAT